jgi:sugar O-acyltransferase (sialic acid O-acetyltransferase NeuD family)
MSGKPIVIFGAGDIAELAWFYFTHDSEFEVAAFTVDSAYRNSDSFRDLPLVDFDRVSDLYPPDVYDFFVALSYAKRNSVRTEKCLAAKSKGYRLVSYISSKATYFPGTGFGENCFVLEDNTIQPFVQIGNNVTLWSGNHIGHHSSIKDNCFITSHVVVSGGVVVGENCFLGVNATLRDHIEIGDHCIVGAGALVLSSTEPRSVLVAQSTSSSKRSD